MIGKFDNVSQSLLKAGIEPDSAEIAWIPSNLVPVDDLEIAKKVLRLIDTLEDLEDVQHVYANYDIEDDVE